MLKLCLLATLVSSPALAQWEGSNFYGQQTRYQQVNTCPAGGKAGTLRVTGSNEQSGKADQAMVEMTVSVSRANSSSTATNTTVDAAQKLINSLTTEPNAVDPADISTESVNVQPVPIYSINKTDDVTYAYSMRISVKISNLTERVLESVLSSAVSSSHYVAINSMKYTISSAKRLQLKRVAQKNAIMNAKDKGLRVAKELGVSISHIISVQDDPTSRYLNAEDNRNQMDAVGNGKGSPGARPSGIAVGTEYVKSIMRITYGICNPSQQPSGDAAAPPS